MYAIIFFMELVIQILMTYLETVQKP